MIKKIQELQGSAQTIYDEAILNDRDLTEEERGKLEELYEEGKEVQKQVLRKQADRELRDEIMGWHVKDDEPKKIGNTLADRVLGNENYQAWFKKLAPSGRISDSFKGITSPPVDLKDIGLFKKTLVYGGDDTGAGAFIQDEVTGIYEPIGYYPTVIRDLVSVRTTESDTVEYVVQTTQVDDAAPVAEPTIVSEGAKPETAVAYAKVTAAVETIAVWIPITKRALSDAGQIRGLINQDLLSDLADEVENQVFNGSGVSPQLDGLANNSDLLTQAYATDLLTTTRKAITKLLVSGKDRPTAWVFNPSDWETFCLLQDGDNRFYYGGPLSAAQDRLWGVPVVQSFHAVTGSAYLANWKRATVFDREAASISISDSHSDFFIRNIVAILAELRAAFAVTRPHSFVKVALTGT